MDFEDEVEKLIDDYGCPDGVKIELQNFLIDSGNAYFIGELYTEYEDETSE